MWRAAQQTFGRCHHRAVAPVALALVGGATFVSIRPASTTLMESAASAASAAAASQKLKYKFDKRECHSYGCPHLPQDIYYDQHVKTALTELRTLKRADVVEDKATGSKEDDSLKVLDASGRKNAGTLTLIGYKGGPLESQINQDRAFCIVPYIVNTKATKRRKLTDLGSRVESYWSESRLIGVFDGHADLGEVVSQYVVSELPKLLASKLKGLEGTTNEITKALIDTFIELDATAPAEQSGGCTASVVFQHGPKVYFANAGDSRSFLVVYREKADSVDIIYVTREDKPDLQDERARVEASGGQVYLPLRGTSRVLYTDPLTGHQSGLAMSRSIGDWEVGKLGVIPDPIVDVVDIPELVHSQLHPPDAPPNKRILPGDDDIHIFAVSATDGMMDFITPEAMGHAIALSLYAKDGPHLLTTLEQLIYIAAQRWEQSKQGRYRDDIAVAVSQIRIPTVGGYAKQ